MAAKRFVTASRMSRLAPRLLVAQEDDGEQQVQRRDIEHAHSDRPRARETRRRPSTTHGSTAAPRICQMRDTANMPAMHSGTTSA